MKAPAITRSVGVRGGDATRIHTTHRMMPIIFVPGMLGTRLSDSKTGKLVWNPTGIPFGPGPRTFKVDYERLNQPGPLIPDEKHGFKNREQKRRYKHIKHYNNVVGTLYGDLLLELASMHGGMFDEFGVKPKVYCCGYDWRQDNGHSALRLADIVEQALFECRAEKCIIVAHEMGGLVARYYCNVLGGEKRVHALFLVGSPTLGTPEAYGKLKSGLGGPNPRSPMGLGIWALMTLINPASLENMYNNLYLMLCMGAGRFIEAEETRRFIRQMPSMYQLMPNSVYCHDNQHWAVFDPLQTGHLPTGSMFVFPSALGGLVEAGTMGLAEIDECARQTGEELKGYYEEYMTPGAALRTSGRAERNVMTLEKFAEELGEAMKKLEKKGDGYQIHKIYKQIKELYDRADECILDTRPHEHFYRDIYTGLLDIVAERPLCAGNLELMFRFEETLKEGDGGHHGGGHGIMKAMLHPLLMAAGVAEGSSHHQQAGEHGGGEHGEGGDHYAGPKVYMHPKTYNIYNDSQEMSVSYVLLHTETLSNDDSNEVHFQMMKIPFGTKGDGSVPVASANPPASRLTHAFEAVKNATGVPYSRLPNDQIASKYIAERIDALVQSFCTGESPAASSSSHGSGSDGESTGESHGEGGGESGGSESGDGHGSSGEGHGSTGSSHGSGGGSSHGSGGGSSHGSGGGSSHGSGGGSSHGSGGGSSHGSGGGSSHGSGGGSSHGSGGGSHGSGGGSHGSGGGGSHGSGGGGSHGSGGGGSHGSGGGGH